MSEVNTPETHTFDTEVHELLKLMVNALYSNREIFLRELISNASDASDKLRFESLTNEALKGLDQDLAIDVCFDSEAFRLVISDRGIGMNRDEVIENLGTIARSGTRQFLESLSGDQQKDASLIGQFGVGFYSAFIVADEVTVETRRADEPAENGVRWTSAGDGEYQLEPIEREAQGTTITLDLREDHRDLLSEWQLKRIIRHYSNHIAFPIRLREVGKEEASEEAVNDSQAMWARAKSELSREDYEEFYSSLTGDPDKPLSWAHHHVEGNQSYSLLLYLPGQAPFDMLINRDEREGVKLYIQRVFIMDAAEQVVPRYLRFMRGVIDSADLPLNISREILQDSPLIRKIQATVIKRSLDLIEKLADEGGENWRKFWQAFGSILKEGVIEDFEQRERIASLLRFASTRHDDDESVGLDDYISRMAEGQDTIWFLTADSLKVAKNSPHLEAFRKRDIEVLLLTDRIDEWLTAHLSEYKGKTLKSVARGKLDLDDDAVEPDEEAKTLAGRVKKALGEEVGNVAPGTRLTDSPSCLVADEDGMTLTMQKMLRQAGQEVPETKPDLEINPDHPILRLMADESDESRFGELSRLLLDQALLAEGGELADPAGYVSRVNRMLVNALGTDSGKRDGDDTNAASS